MNNNEQMDFERIEDMAIEAQKGKCENLFEELKKMEKAVFDKVLDLYDEMCFLNELTQKVYFKRGYKKAVNNIDGLI